MSHLLTHAMCTAQLILLDLLVRILFGEEYISVISPLCIFLHFPLTSWAQIFSSTPYSQIT
jgi:hypothetical protein